MTRPDEKHKGVPWSVTQGGRPQRTRNTDKGYPLDEVQPSGEWLMSLRCERGFI